MDTNPKAKKKAKGKAETGLEADLQTEKILVILRKERNPHAERKPSKCVNSISKAHAKKAINVITYILAYALSLRKVPAATEETANSFINTETEQQQLRTQNTYLKFPLENPLQLRLQSP